MKHQVNKWPVARMGSSEHRKFLGKHTQQLVRFRLDFKYMCTACGTDTHPRFCTPIAVRGTRDNLLDRRVEGSYWTSRCFERRKVPFRVRQRGDIWYYITLSAIFAGDVNITH